MYQEGCKEFSMKIAQDLEISSSRREWTCKPKSLVPAPFLRLAVYGTKISRVLPLDK